MGWCTTVAVEDFLAEAGEFLHADPARNTVIVSVTASLLPAAAARSVPRPDQARSGPARDDQPLFGWWRPAPGGDRSGCGGNVARATQATIPAPPVRGAFMHTPAFPVVLTSMSNEAAAQLAAELAAAGRPVLGVNAETPAAEAFADTWRRRTGAAATVHRLMRLHRLGRLVRPHPAPEGMPRIADERDRDLLIEWFGAFAAEVDDPVAEDHAAAVDIRLSYGGITVWEVDGVPVSFAAVTRTVSGMVRVGPVYTPPARRGRGYAGAATATVSQAALEAGVTEVVLYTDLANPTSNALYHRLGYRPVEDRVVLAFAPAPAAAR